MKEKGERNAGMGDSAYNVLGLPDLELASQHYITDNYNKLLLTVIGKGQLSFLS